MHEREIALLSSFLEQSASYFEFGMGGSTCLAAKLVSDRVAAVDSSAKWVGKVRAAIGEAVPQIDLRHVEIGPLRGWGMPLDRASASLFDAYSLAIVDNGPFDFCLIDGRFRVACFLQALLSAEADSVIAVHDYRVRPEYHIVETFARPISECRQLTMFVRRPEAQLPEIERCAQAFRRDPA